MKEQDPIDSVFSSYLHNECSYTVAFIQFSSNTLKMRGNVNVYFASQCKVSLKIVATLLLPKS